MNFIDRVVEAFAPERAFRRAFAREQLRRMDQIAAKRSGYEGAKSTRLSWSASSNGANAEIGPYLPRLRARSHDLVRNNPYAARAISSLAGNSIGTGFALKVPKKLQPYWKAWTEYADAEGELDYYGMQALIARTVYESGSCLVRERTRRPEDGLEIPVQYQVMEPDYLDVTKHGEVSGGGYIWGGIEYNAIGQRVAYWLYPQHPGDVAMFRARSLDSKRVPAQFIQHIYEKLRPGQADGVPRFAASMLRMRDLDDYEEAELVRKGYEACFAAFVIGKDGSRTLGQTAVDPSNGRRIESISAGMVAYLDDAQDVRFGQPAPSGGYGEYTVQHLHAIAAGAGLTYETMTGDLSRVNFTSHRAGLLEYRRLVECWQWLTFVPMHANRTLRGWERHARIAGKIRQKEPLVPIWTPPKWDWVDPLKEVKAVREEMAGGLASLSEKLRARGYDPDEVFAEIGQDVQALASAAGIPADLVFQIMFQTGGASAGGAQAEDDPANPNPQKE